MAITLKQTEGLPDSYPAIDPAVPDEVWQRIESWVAHRWTERAVVWLVEGCGEWVPPLTPATITTVEIWSDRAKDWEVTTLDAAPLGGYFLPATGPYRFTGTVASGVVLLPAAVEEAAQRLSAYMAAVPAPGIASESIPGIGDVTYASPSWMARALQNSGAGDLLRPYRRA
ncbi:MAG: hypothetical protein E6Q97_31725 [Desulfurellales bacterium]|nr:MAG: hypothetical protein E6Q97_31725 [Desulfurellales bacterium]